MIPKIDAIPKINKFKKKTIYEEIFYQLRKDAKPEYPRNKIVHRFRRNINTKKIGMRWAELTGRSEGDRHRRYGLWRLGRRLLGHRPAVLQRVELPH